MINVTKSYLPPIEEYTSYLKVVWESGWLTNNGVHAQRLETELKEYLGVKHLFFVTNGTIAIQIAIKALDLKGEILTTPFSYVATTSSIIWENCIPIFIDIDKNTLNVDSNKLEEGITDKTVAILATHVFGNPCAVEHIEKIAKKYNLKVIYDAAHAFGTTYKKTSVLNYGDVSTLSFHATKLFHTVEGGAIVTNDDDLAHKISYMRNFGHNGPEQFWGLGVNGKNSEFHAAMGLCVLPNVTSIIHMRTKWVNLYHSLLKGCNIQNLVLEGNTTKYNYAYYPILLKDEATLLKIMELLKKNNILARRYFYPSLNTLPYLQQKEEMPIAENVSSRVLCLPLFFDMSENLIKEITNIIKSVLEHN